MLLYSINLLNYMYIHNMINNFKNLMKRNISPNLWNYKTTFISLNSILSRIFYIVSIILLLLLMYLINCTLVSIYTFYAVFSICIAIILVVLL